MILPGMLLLLCLLLVLFGWMRVRSRRRFLVIAPGCRDRSHRHGLSLAKDFLDLPCVRIGGHRHRYVARVGLPAGFGETSSHASKPDKAFTLKMGTCPEAAWPGALLKVENRIPLLQRIASLRMGRGLASASEREALNLDMAARYGLPAPPWIAYGEHRGRSFLLVSEISGAVSLGQAANTPRMALNYAGWMGKTLAKMHALGVVHGDLFLKHVLFDPEKGEPVLVDWQRARVVHAPRISDRLRDLAALASSLPPASEFQPGVPDESASTRLRQRILSRALSAYLSQSSKYPNPGATLPGFAELWNLIDREVRQLVSRHGPRGSQSQQGHRPGHDWVVVPREHCREFAWTTLGIEKTQSVQSAMEWMGEAAPRLTEHGRVQGIRWIREASGKIVAGIAWWKGKRPIWGIRIGKRPIGPEIALSRRLFHLDNLGIEGPKVLARGVQRIAGSKKVRIHFLIFQPPKSGMSVALWLRRTAFHPGLRRKSLLEAMGRALANLHGKGVLLFSSKPGNKSASKPLPGRSIPFCVNPTRSQVWLECPAECSFQGKNLVGSRESWSDLGSLLRRLVALGASPLEASWLQQAFLTTANPSVSKMESGFQIQQSPKPILAHAMASDGSGRGLSSATSPLVARVAQGPSASIRESHFQMDSGRHLPPLREGNRSWADDDWIRFAGPNWVDSIMDAKVTDRYHTKQGRSVGRWILEDPEGTGEKLVVYLKRHNILPAFDGLMAKLAPRWAWSPALQEWQHLRWASELGIPVPKAFAVAEFQGPGTKLQSCLALGELTGMIPLHEAVPLAYQRMEPSRFHQWKRGLLMEMARIGRLLHDRRCFHKDFYFCHFYIREVDTYKAPASWFNEVVLIDLHRLARHRIFWRIYQIKDLAQLLFSSEVEGVNASDRVAFWRAYRGLGAGEGRGKGFYERIVSRIIRWKWQRYRRHNMKLEKGVRRAA